MPAIDVLRELRRNYPLYASQYLRIKDKDGKIVPLALNRAQQYVHEQIENQLRETGRVRVLVLKGRQQGISTYTEGRLYWRTTLNGGKTAFILTHEDKATTNIFGMAKNYHDNLPPALRPHTGASNANELVFDRLKSRYAVGTARTTGTGRSFTVHYFHGSEAAFWLNAKDHLAGLGQTVPDLPGTEIIIESTANGIGNMFHTMTMQAMRGEGDYRLIFVPWYWQPEYTREVPEGWSMTEEELEYKAIYDLTDGQMVWRRAKVETDFQGDSGLFDQEYPASIALAFRSSTLGSYLELPLIEKAMSTDIQPDEQAPKIMGVDPAEYGEDASAIACRQGRVVLPIDRYRKKGTMEIVGLTAIKADAWKPDAINVDCTGIGSGVADRLLELGYPVNRVHNGERAVEEALYIRRKEEMYGAFKKWLEDSPCSLPNDEVLKTDMVGPTYSYDSSRRLVMESKEKMKARGIPSPDSADAVALTFAVRIAARKQQPRRAPANWRVA